MKKIFGWFNAYHLLAVLVTILALTFYIALQQMYRQSANDPQIQMARDDAANLANNSVTPISLAATPVNIDKSLATFTIVYDADKNIIANPAVIDGKLKEPPKGVLDTAKIKNENRVTWEPQKGKRFALVVEYFKGDREGYVVVGRSLSETENRIGILGAIILAGWAICMLKIIAASYIIKNL